MIVSKFSQKNGFTPLETAKACFSHLIWIAKNGKYSSSQTDNMRKRYTKRSLSLTGFTLLEVIITIGIIAILLALGLVSFSLIRFGADLNRTGGDIVSTLELARSESIASEGSSSYGVHLSSTGYSLFRGITYSATAPDNISHALSSGLEIYNLNLGGWPDIVFARITGAVDSAKAGSFGIRLTGNPSENIIIDVKISGEVNIESSQVIFSGTRATDSRHIHFSYSRIIDTATETLTLKFSNPPNPDVLYNIPIKNYISGGKFDWFGTVNVGGQNQILNIHTHILNDPLSGTTFSVHRDGRYNTKALTLILSGDLTGNPAGEILRYSAAGQEYQGSSIYAGVPARQ